MRARVALACAIAPLAVAIGCRRDAPPETHDYPVVKYQRADASFEGADAHAADLAVVEMDAGPAPSTSIAGYGPKGLFVRTPRLVSWLVSGSGGGSPDRATVEKRLRARFGEILDCRGTAKVGRVRVVVRFDALSAPGLSGRVIGRAQTTDLPLAVGQCLLDLVRAEVPRGAAGTAFEIILWL